MIKIKIYTIFFLINFILIDIIFKKNLLYAYQRRSYLFDKIQLESGSKGTIKNINNEKAKINSKDYKKILNEYKLLIQKKINDVKIYPLSERLDQPNVKQSVIVKVYFKLNKFGKVLEKKVIKSSHLDLFDDAALQSINDASPLPPIPEKLNLDECEIELNLEFDK